ncbi:MAG: type II secretion system GspH family protein [Patescibacteria group bacterium]|nr:type II secretion system GspH family protein [Patescibacteria group bacterium]MCL5262071.1 type II secretion system GspH family protein [Patescibacteria group bacterium]
MKSQKGFTLVEMVIVIAVIGILMGLVFNGTRSVQANARDTRRQADLKKVQTYLELYFNKCGHYPVTTFTIPADSCKITAAPTYNQLVTLLESTVASGGEMPHDPITTPGHEYQYGVDIAAGQQGFDYVLGAQMEKGVPTGGVTTDPLYGIAGCGTTLYCVK